MPEKKAFTLRLGERTHDTLKLAADQCGVTMTSLVTTLLEQELEILSFGLENHLAETVRALQDYRGQGADDDIAEFARAEVEEADPIQTRLAEVEGADRYGVAEIFA